MKAIVKARPAAGLELQDVPEPVVGPGDVLIAVEAASVCGTDLHIYQWDAWSASRIRPPRIIGHEFCGRIVAVGDQVTARAVGDYVASESHVVDAASPWMKAGLAHVDPDTRILGVDIDGGFAPRVAIPWENARPTAAHVPPEIACFQDALGNAVHTAMAGPVHGQRVLITGLGPIGLFAVAVCRALGAAEITGVEPSPFRSELAHALGIDRVLHPDEAHAAPEVDATLEMSGHPSSLALAVDRTRPGGRISCLGVYKENSVAAPLNDIIFKGLTVQGIVGRHLWNTWAAMGDLLRGGRLDLGPIVTHQMPYTEFESAMDLLSRGAAGKVVLRF